VVKSPLRSGKYFIETESGIWFRDVRRPMNHRRVLADWPTPDGLEGMSEIDVDIAQADLKARAFDFGFPLYLLLVRPGYALETFIVLANHSG